MSKKRVLMTGGRGPATLELARQFNQLGHEVYVAESRRIHFCTFSNAVKEAFVLPNPLEDETGFIETLKELLITHRIDYLIPTYDEIYFIAKHKKLLSRYVQVICDQIAMIDTLNNKAKFMAWMTQLGLKVPNTRIVDSKDAYHALLAENAVPYPHMLKPAYTGGGVDIIKIRDHEHALSVNPVFPILVQDFIEGEWFCTFSVAHSGTLSCHAAYKPLYIYRENGASVCFKAIEDQSILDFVSEIVKAANFTGMLGFDLMRTNDGSLYAIECNPRITSGVHLLEKDDNIAEHFFALQPFHLICPERPRQISRAAMLRILGTTVKNNFDAWFQQFIHAKEAIFNWRDPLPTIMFPLICSHFFIQYLFFKKKPEQTIFYNAHWEIEGDGAQAKLVARAHKSTHPVTSPFYKPSAPRA
jgi:predicted ATP-grasp superfamily ATP-dependent carboligase